MDVYILIGILIIVIILLIKIYFMDKEIKKLKIEGYSGNDEAIANLASIMNTKETMVVNDLVVKKNLKVDGDIEIGPSKTIKSSGRLHIASGEFLYLLPKKDLMITKDWGSNGNVQVHGHLSVRGGSNFEGGRHMFKDSENAGRLRVGAAWGKPGIYAEDGKSLVLGASNARIETGPQQNLHITPGNYIGMGQFKVGEKSPGHFVVAGVHPGLIVRSDNHGWINNQGGPPGGWNWP